MNLGLGLMLGSRGPSGPGFQPTDLPGCVLWLRADQGITTSGGEVTAWADQSGVGDAGRIFLPGSATRPGYNNSDPNYGGLPTIGTFHKAGNCRLVSNTWSATYTTVTLLVVGHSIDYGFYTFDSLTDHLAISQSSPSVAAYGGDASVYLAGTGSSTSPKTVLAAEYNGAASKLFLDGLVTPLASGTLPATTLGTGPFTVGSYGADDSALYGVERLAEVMAFSRILTDPEKVQLRTYLNTRYGKTMTT